MKPTTKIFIPLLILVLGMLSSACSQERKSQQEKLEPAGALPTVTTAPAVGMFVDPITRPQDPVILTGADFPEFLNLPISELKLYAFNNAAWNPIPFQVDEVDSSGFIVAPGTDDQDGGLALLDGNDQLVFMGHDAGTTSTCADSLDLMGDTHLRQTITITDTLNSDTGFAYLFHGDSLPLSPGSYVDWNPATQTITGTYQNSYVATFGGAKNPQFLGLADLHVNGSSDLVDRQKLLLDLSVEISPPLCFPINCTFSEQGSTNPVCNSFWASMEPYINIQFQSLGPVRAASSLGFFFYGSKYEANLVVDFSALEQNENICQDSVDIHQFQIATDLNDPSTHGVDTYYDSNASLFTIDGIPDAVPTTPLIDWYQTSGGDSGGVVTALNAIYPNPVTASNHYIDDSSAGGTGDGASYGEAGIDFSNAGADYLGLQLSTYILPTATTTNVGETYHQYATTPLTALTAAETCEPSGYPVFLPMVLTSGGD